MITLNGKQYNNLMEGVVLEVEKFNTEWKTIFDDMTEPKDKKEMINVTPDIKQITEKG